MEKTSWTKHRIIVLSFTVLCTVFPAISQIPEPAAGKQKTTTPIARIKGSVVCCPQDTIILDGWASIAPGGEVVKWGWDLNGDRQVDTTTEVGELMIVAPTTPVTKTIFLVVKDRKGQISRQDSIAFCVMNAPPRASIKADTTIKIGVRLSFEPRVTCTCGSAVKYEWDFNDDGLFEFKSEETPNTSRVFYKPGKYYARFRITDNFGREAGCVQIINVSAEHAKSL